MLTLLFFDDCYLHRRTNLARHVGTPRLVPEGTLEDPYLDPAWGYPTVFQDPQSGTWRCLYQGQIENGHFVPVLTESQDGVHWEFPDLTERVPLSDRVAPHQLFGLERFTEWNGPYLDPQAVGADAWLKGPVVVRRSGGVGLGSVMVTSPDGIHWQHRLPLPAGPAPLERGAYIIVLDLQSLEPADLLKAPQAGFGTLGQTYQPVEVAVASHTDRGKPTASSVQPPADVLDLLAQLVAKSLVLAAGTPSASRLAASRCSSGQALSRRSISRAQASIRCSQLSMTNSSRRGSGAISQVNSRSFGWVRNARRSTWHPNGEADFV